MHFCLLVSFSHKLSVYFAQEVLGKHLLHLVTASAVNEEHVLSTLDDISRLPPDLKSIALSFKTARRRNKS